MTQWARLLQAAEAPDSTPFDYIVVGSGAGGGPLAARLALEGRRVLVIEAGVDPASRSEDVDPQAARSSDGIQNVREIYAVPAYHAASTEDKDISWDFSVRHFADCKRQGEDTKYCKRLDKSASGQKGQPKGGIFYPRAAALGGCTAHHAMVIVRPNDSDWDRIAELTGDASWRSETMQGYFAKIEHCLYYQVYKDFLGRILGGILWLIQWAATHISPRRQLDPGGHGSAGWQKTSFIDPLVIVGILKGDRTFLSILRGALCWMLRNKTERSLLARAVAYLQIVQFLDPNVRSPDFPTRGGRLSLIPMGTDGRSRCGLREHLLDIATKHPDRLVLLCGAHVRRVLFESRVKNGAPRAIGVDVARGPHLYRASPKAPASKELATAQYFARHEVIICAGAFNTPQILMLSGVGDAAHLTDLGIEGPRDRLGKEVAERIDLAAVGANLQDRYEISVISRTKKEFSTLKGVTFQPGGVDDPALTQWRAKKTGLYTTNGGALSLMASSEGNRRPEPDLLFFGAPAAVRGYYPGWSKQLLYEIKDKPESEVRGLWSWVILKAYAENKAGTVRLFSADPYDTPEINFHSFSGDHQRDLDALCDGVRKVRDINGHIRAIAEEIWPNDKRHNDSQELKDWVQAEAWGHHACGTCSIGADPWRDNLKDLEDRNAVVDSEFRVHGVRGLRVVDASVFPEIPGYFIVTSVFMIAEKAADTLLASRRDYPNELEQAEAAAVHARRKAVDPTKNAGPTPTILPQDTVGIALSGGGIRSATFCLGVLQALAACRKLRNIDFLSTVSGGGYSGAFLGRLYTRLAGSTGDKADRAEGVLAQDDSPELWWLRKNADYANSAGRVDLEVNLAIIARNLLAVHLLVGALLFGVFGALRWLPDAAPQDLVPALTIWGVKLSFWWWVPLFVLSAVVAPLAVGYWLAPKARRDTALVPLLLWVAALASAVYGLAVPDAALWSGAAIGVLLLAWVLQEVAQPRLRRVDSGSHALRSAPSNLMRNRLTRALGTALLALAACLLWVVLDSLARSATQPEMMPMTVWAMAGAAPVLFALRVFGRRWTSRDAEAGQWYLTARKAIAGGLGFVLAAILLFFIDVLVHLAFDVSAILGSWTTITALAISAIAGRWLAFLNLSSLQQSYAQKLVRTFLGATNDARVRPSGSNASLAVEISSPQDDLFFDEYHPERAGGPLHLINVCLNDTVVSESGRQLREDKSLPMCLGPSGVSVGRRYHALWEAGEAPPAAHEGLLARSSRALRRLIERAKDRAGSVVRPIPVGPDPNAFHVLARSDGVRPTVERLRLGQWTSISGAAVAPGTGRFTTLPQSLFLGIINFRLGYWWDSGIRAGQRPSRYPPGFWRRLKALPASIFRMHSTLLNEWRGYFAGPAERLWYLSDGGHFDNTGLYELIRRRLPFIIAVDGGDDPDFRLDELAILTRQVRLDFDAEIEWLDGSALKETPAWIQEFINLEAVGPLGQLKRDGGYCSILGRITYRGTGRTSWLLVVKANLAPPVPLDVKNYADRHVGFPNEPIADQFFSDDQWESYRKLGQCAGAMVFRKSGAGGPQVVEFSARRPSGTVLT